MQLGALRLLLGTVGGILCSGMLDLEIVFWGSVFSGACFWNVSKEREIGASARGSTGVQRHD